MKKPFKRLFRLPRRKVEETVDLEIRHHIEMRIDELIDEGHRPEEARRIAEDAFGDLVRYRGECVSLQRREERKMRWMDGVASWWGDVGYALRGLRRNPGFALAVIATLTLGLGASTAMYSVVDSVLLRPVPYEDAEELFDVGTRYEEGWGYYFFPWDGIVTIRDAEVFPVVGAHGRVDIIRTDGEFPDNLNAQAIVPEVLEILRMEPFLGRGILPEDARPAAPDVAVVSHAYWRGGMASDPDVLGRVITLNDRPHTVVGVAHPDLRFPHNTVSFYVPLRTDGTALGNKLRQVQAVVRLPGAETLDSHLERWETLSAGMQELGPTEGNWTGTLHSLNDAQVNDDVRRALWVAFAAVSVMLLIAVVNCVNLILARGTARSRELGVRLALGASRGRVVRQLVIESAVLAVFAGALSTVVALYGVQALMGVAPERLTWLSNNPEGLDARAAAFTFAVTVVSGFVLGVFPALHAVRRRDVTSNRAIGAYAASESGRSKLRGALVVTQVSLSVTLLVAAALLGSSFARLLRVDPGFDTAGLIMLDVDLNDTTYPENEMVLEFSREMRDRIAAIPGVTAVGRSSGSPPNTGITFGDRLELEGREELIREGDVIIGYGSTGEQFADAVGLELLSGRYFDANDFLDGRSAIVDEDLARALVGSIDAVGARFRLGEEDRWYEIVGVVRDLKILGLQDPYSEFAMLRPLSVSAAYGYISFSIRAALPEAELYPQLRELVREMDPKLPIDVLTTARAAMVESVDRPRFFMILMVVFATAAALLASIGLYGVLAFAVNRRQREMGIRIALGAGASAVRSMVLRDGLRLAVGGTILGLILAALISGRIEAMLFQVGRLDPVAYGFVAALMIGVAALAAYIPAHRATRVDPVRVLSSE